MKNALIIICAVAGLCTAAPTFASSQMEAASDGRGVTAAPKTGRDIGHNAKADAASYAAREKAAPQAGTFNGGDGANIYIGGSTVAVILLVVLLVVLL